jgi:hypothetical protein
MRVYRFCNVGPERADPRGGQGQGMSTASHDDHDVVVVDRSGGGGGAATILGVIVVALLVVGIWFFAFGPGQGTFGGSTDQPNDINVNVELPSVAPDAS